MQEMNLAAIVVLTVLMGAGRVTSYNIVVANVADFMNMLDSIMESEFSPHLYDRITEAVSAQTGNAVSLKLKRLEGLDKYYKVGIVQRPGGREIEVAVKYPLVRAQFIDGAAPGGGNKVQLTVRNMKVNYRLAKQGAVLRYLSCSIADIGKTNIKINGVNSNKRFFFPAIALIMTTAIGIMLTAIGVGVAGG